MEVPQSDPFSHLPAEIILQCFCSLSSFWDALHFAAACQQNYQIWTANVNIIYHHISPRAIQCRRYARTLLADQGGSPADSHNLTTHDVLQLVRNTVVMKKSIEEFNNSTVHHFATSRLQPDKTSWPYFGNKPRPPYLIKPERARFVRGLYQLWGLVLLEPKARRQRLESFCLKDLVTLGDLTQYGDIMIYDKTVIAMQEADPYHAQMERVYSDLIRPLEHKMDELPGRKYGPSAGFGYLGRMSIWHNNVEDLKEYVTTNRKDPTKKAVSDSDLSELWYDTPEEDLSD